MRYQRPQAIPPSPGPWAHTRNKTKWPAGGRSRSLLVLIRKAFLFLGQPRNHVLPGCPIGQILDPAPIAAKGHVRIVELNWFTANRTKRHRTNSIERAAPIEFGP